MSLLRTAIAVFALVASLTCIGAAGAEPYIPPGNSAATQYTEAIPTAGGNVEVNADIGEIKRSATKALGKKTVRALAEEGDEGAAVAAIVVGTGAAASDSGSEGGGGGSGSDPAEGSSAAGADKGGPGADGSGAGRLEPGAGGSGPAGDQADGSSGVGEVVSQATLFSSGEMGVFLPLVLLAALIWALLFAWRRRERSPAP